ncbi:DUF58 domain-containing protein [Pseudenhygromyxa sp. WMMC2535]|uniref:DUF58 domain-containing protein n=1 Tax=Pseudenhygromyxa sp. WMMC2535 TaxID=2712867 RepID=UPI00155615C6|nr:DUF58 domain-containing protein [Pseudenhygromyxa sp. WMMC2535]NVB43224.1 DUF58 domain-containing protein [Pseudenhygromyxa sp. WMMC2535]
MQDAKVTAKKKKIPLLRRMLSAYGRSLEITKAGWLFILLTLAVGFAAINSGANLLHVLFGCQIGLIIASGMLSENMVRRAEVRRKVASPLHAEGRGALIVELRNASPRGDMISVSVEDDDRFDSPDHTEPVFSVAVRGGATATLHTSVTMTHRGLHPLPKAVVATRFPFGLFVKRLDLQVRERVLVYPRIHPVDVQELRQAYSGEGEALGSRARAGEFFGLAEYRDGQELRRIHWPATARLGKAVVQEFEARGEGELVLSLLPGRGGDPSFEAAVEEVASQAVALLDEGRVATGLRYGDELVIEPGTGPAHERRVLEFLALVGLDPDPNSNADSADDAKPGAEERAA